MRIRNCVPILPAAAPDTRCIGCGIPTAWLRELRGYVDWQHVCFDCIPQYEHRRRWPKSGGGE